MRDITMGGVILCSSVVVLVVSTAPTHPVSALIKCLAVCMSSTPAVSVEILTLLST